MLRYVAGFAMTGVAVFARPRAVSDLHWTFSMSRFLLPEYC